MLVAEPKRARPYSPYLEALFQALLAGHYVPELIDVYFRESNFQTPHAWPMDLGH